MRLLLVEDDMMVGQSTSKALRLEGFIVDWVRDAVPAVLALDVVSYALMLLDIGLPKKDGLTLLRECRKRGITIPTIIITAREDVENRVAGLNCGADDYLVKPVDFRELVARIRAVTRRHAGRANPELTSGTLRLNPMTHEVFQNDLPIILSPREFALLQVLLQARESVLSR
jgi:two-component system, OmpR family, response regulator QseB